MKRPVKTLKSHRMLPATLCSMAAAAAVGHVGGDDARAASMGFFKENAKKDGVVSLPSGLQWRGQQTQGNRHGGLARSRNHP